MKISTTTTRVSKGEPFRLAPKETAPKADTPSSISPKETVQLNSSNQSKPENIALGCAGLLTGTLIGCLLSYGATPSAVMSVAAGSAIGSALAIGLGVATDSADEKNGGRLFELGAKGFLAGAAVGGAFSGRQVGFNPETILRTAFGGLAGVGAASFGCGVGIIFDEIRADH